MAPTYETFLSFIHPEDLPMVKQEVARALKSGKYGPYDYRIVRSRWLDTFLQTRGETRYDPEGQPLSVGRHGAGY